MDSSRSSKTLWCHGRCGLFAEPSSYCEIGLLGSVGSVGSGYVVRMPLPICELSEPHSSASNTASQRCSERSATADITSSW